MTDRFARENDIIVESNAESTNDTYEEAPTSDDAEGNFDHELVNENLESARKTVMQ